MFFVLLLILLVLLFGRNIVLELLHTLFVEWLDSVLLLFNIIYVLCHVALLVLVYPVVHKLVGETVALISLILVVAWQISLLWQRYKKSPVEPVDEVKKRNASLWRGDN